MCKLAYSIISVHVFHLPILCILFLYVCIQEYLDVHKRTHTKNESESLPVEDEDQVIQDAADAAGALMYVSILFVCMLYTSYITTYSSILLYTILITLLIYKYHLCIYILTPMICALIYLLTYTNTFFIFVFTCIHTVISFVSA